MATPSEASAISQRTFSLLAHSAAMPVGLGCGSGELSTAGECSGLSGGQRRLWLGNGQGRPGRGGVTALGSGTTCSAIGIERTALRGTLACPGCIGRDLVALSCVEDWPAASGEIGVSDCSAAIARGAFGVCSCSSCIKLVYLTYDHAVRAPLVGALIMLGLLVFYRNMAGMAIVVQLSVMPARYYNGKSLQSGETLRVLAVADHVEPQLYDNGVADWLGPVDVIISCGDLPPYYLDFLVSTLGAPLFHVLGNHCFLPTIR